MDRRQGVLSVDEPLLVSTKLKMSAQLERRASLEELPLSELAQQPLMGMRIATQRVGHSPCLL